ncbi:MAG: hypothetical protein SFU27_07770 [Thermonemataceae bacterium]|nr:hypothetical protein [Thermonemataceae bacterium]
MKKIVVYAPFLGNIAGITLYPFILLKHRHYKDDKYLMNHEEIHLQQQLEMLVLPFYIFYLLNYVFNLIKYKNHEQAYLNICFEREAYKHEKDLLYLKKRRFFASLKFL